MSPLGESLFEALETGLRDFRATVNGEAGRKIRALGTVQGPLADAIRASLSIPVLVEPWQHQGRYLLDGGIVNPLPASVLRDRGADVVIASSVVQPISESYRGDTEQMPNLLQIISNVYSAMEAEVIRKQLPLIDVLIQHHVTVTHALDFDQAADLVEAGEQAARQMLSEIKQAIETSANS